MLQLRLIYAIGKMDLLLHDIDVPIDLIQLIVKGTYNHQPTSSVTVPVTAISSSVRAMLPDTPLSSSPE